VQLGGVNRTPIFNSKGRLRRKYSEANYERKKRESAGEGVHILEAFQAVSDF
jgi:hypothetical protein